LTPHEGEFPRLFSDLSNKHPGRSKLERVRDAAVRCRRSGALEGRRHRGRLRPMVAPTDCRPMRRPWLATAGAGDVLAGFIAEMLAQGVAAFEAASIGVWMHGEAACEAGRA
jgi:NAD(P)H-hydrate repair Nnr-like enzyme with NAD(P)H-hydrate dehydratase domain